MEPLWLLTIGTVITSDSILNKFSLSGRDYLFSVW